MEAAFIKALPVLEKLEQAGFEAYFVGGSIRDALLGLPIHDVDIATSAYPQEVQGLFPKHFDVGLQHGTVMAWVAGETYEITTFRSESTYQDYRRPDSVTFVKSLKEDLLRRDFTINALAMDRKGGIIDYFSGQEDLEAGLIRCVGLADERLHEDALRMMRAVRFSSQLGFNIETATAKALAFNAPLLRKIAVERIAQEFNKLWLGKQWQRGLQSLVEADLANYTTMPKALIKSLPLMLSYFRGASFPSSNLAWASLVFLSCIQGDHFLEEGRALVSSFVKAFKLSKADLQAQNKMLAIYYACYKKEPYWPELLFNYGEHFVFELARFIEAEQKQQSKFGKAFCQIDTRKLAIIYQNLVINHPRDLAINGHDIITHFPSLKRQLIGVYIEKAQKAVIYRHCPNERTALLAFLEKGGQA